MAESSKFTAGEEATLATIIERWPKEHWAFLRLEQRYLDQGNTVALCQMYKAQQPVDPDELALKNNWAATALLLKQATDEAHRTARDVFERTHTNLAFATTYAFSLHVQGKTDEGLKVLETFPRAELEQPEHATYYGLLLAAAGRNTEARTLLERALKGPLLPEERALVEKAIVPEGRGQRRGTVKSAE